MKKQFLSLLIIIMVFVTIAYGAKSNISAPKNVKIFVLRDGTALWQENRDVVLEKGENFLEFLEVPLTIDNPSIILRSLTEPENFKVLETGLSKPLRQADSNRTIEKYESIKDINNAGVMLFARVITNKSGSHKCELIYRVRGLQVIPRYVALLGPKGTMDLKGATNVKNGCGLTINNAAIYFPFEKIPYHETPVLRRSYSVSSHTNETRKVIHSLLQLISTPVSVENNQDRNFEFTSLTKISFKKINLYDGLPMHIRRFQRTSDYVSSRRSQSYSIQHTNSNHVKIIYNLDTSTFKTPEDGLPDADVQVYGLSNNKLIFEQGYLDFDRLNNRYRIITGQHPGLVGNRKQLAFKEIVPGQSCEETIEVSIRNNTAKTQEVWIREHLVRSEKYKIQKSSQEYNEIKPGLIEFKITVNPAKSSVVEYTLQYEY